ncbi:hypothetical protein Pint_36267 [Pistacia integerrima]|uniref:Uncharacterized protein n=1 Tax=Pistacia integerrima TaxID=434235 RepID=A0ACC0Y2W6_9ROSI|nr:hypothetical protein Pint_36267 [Pistacia integerrima]
MEELKPVNSHHQNDDVDTENEDDKPMLSSQAIAALQEFLAEQNQNLETETPESESHTIALVSENWRLSQFWYDAVTAETIASEVVSLCSNSDSRVACIALSHALRLFKDLPLELKHAFSVVIADPPYLSKECLEKITQTVSFLARPGDSFVLLLTGEVQKDRAAKLLGLRPCGFRPRHSSKLGNEFCLFTNYDPEMRLGGWEQEQ